ncbi:carboxypeptidase M-like isoform X2 [Amphibalanus amphitrite]|nr:carboxypeptidase M-like isoform X2 [Amphibalanus amphitrite]
MRTAKWYMCVFLVAFLYFYVMLIKQVRGAEVPPRPLLPAEDRQAPAYEPPQFDPQFQDGETDSVGFSYHNYDQLTAYMRKVAAERPDITALYSIGTSVQGRELWVLVVSASPYEHMIGKPNVKYVGNIHGNEAIGREVLIHLIEYLTTRYNTDPYVSWLLDNTRVHIMPSMNPDGFEVSREGSCQGGQGRFNSNGFDLNRNFPDYFKTNNKKSQVETEAIKEWLNKIQFVLSAQLHGGALVASYPFDNTPNADDGNSVRDSPVPQRTGRAWYDPVVQPVWNALGEPIRVIRQFRTTESRSPDDDTLRHLAKVYSYNHGQMYKGEPCANKGLGAERFPDGITNGAKWYPLTGGMGDYNYVWHGCMELTLELSCCKYPEARQLRSFWRDNRKALVKLLGEAHRGVRGYVVDINNNPIEGAGLKVKGRNIGFQTTQHGEFWRILRPGNYVMEVFAEGYYPREQAFSVSEERPTEISILLERVPEVNRHDFTPPPLAPPPPTAAPSGLSGLWTRLTGGFQSLFG